MGAVHTGMSPPDKQERPAVNRAPTTPPKTSTDSVRRGADDSGEVDRTAVLPTSPKKKRQPTRVEIAALQTAILEVCKVDHPLTVRGVFYRVMSRGVVEKSERAYGSVQYQVLKLRRAGELPYEWIADGTRWHVKDRSWASVEQALADAASSYRRALWHDQNVYVEVWSEKEAISSIVSPITNAWDVPLMIARGFASESFLWTTASTIRDVGKPTIVYQLGDHDPSGVAAWRHVQKRLRDFAPDVDITFERLAVTAQQIDEFALPTRPTKKTDSRSKTFRGESVEIDAIPTRILTTLVETAITGHIEPARYEATRVAEEQERRGLEAMAAGWTP